MSETSARVGIGADIIDSSICVATMTGLPNTRQRDTIRFCSTGTVTIGHSTPKSPRATITISDALIMLSKSSSTCGFSSFEIIHARLPIILRASLMSDARCTKDRQMQSTPSPSANCKSLWSFSVSGEILSDEFGRFTPLCPEITPPTSTSVSADSLLHFKTFNTIFPSLTSSLSPAFNASKISLCGSRTLVSSPGISCMSSVNFCPFFNKTLPSLNVPIRSFGPCISATTVTRTPFSFATRLTIS